MINPTDNQSRAIEISNCVAFLKTLIGNLPALLADDSTIPGQTPPVIVADSVRSSALELETLNLLFSDNVESAAAIVKNDNSGSQNAGAIPARRRNSSAEVVQVGDFHIYGDKTAICVWLPRDTSAITLPIFDANKPEHINDWVLTGTDDAPTLTPSIFRDPPNGYHGFLNAGVFTDDLNPPCPITPSPASHKLGCDAGVTQSGPCTCGLTNTPPPGNAPPTLPPTIKPPQTPSAAANPTHFTDLPQKPRKNSINGVEIG